MDIATLKIADGTEMQAHVARPEAVATKGVVVLQEAFGVNDYMRRMTERFADLSYLALAPELFHRTAPPGFEASYTDYEAVRPHMEGLTDGGIKNDIQASIAWLVSEGVAPDKIAVVGFCMGGRASFLANAEFPIGAAVSFYGGGIAQTLLSRAGELHGPQLLLWGGKDAHILPDQTRAVADALRAAGKPFVEATFSEGGHGFACDARAAYHAPSAREAWALADAFLAEYLV